jgi:hypothetical protein
MSPAAGLPDAGGAAAMPSMPGMPGMGTGDAAMTMTVPAWSVAVSSVTAAMLLAGTLWLMRRPVLDRSRPGVGRGMTAAMAAAMAASVLLLV